MSISVDMRQAGSAHPRMWIVSINGMDHYYPEPRESALARVERVKAVIARMRAEGQTDVQILGKYSALPHQH